MTCIISDMHYNNVQAGCWLNVFTFFNLSSHVWILVVTCVSLSSDVDTSVNSSGDVTIQ